MSNQLPRIEVNSPGSQSPNESAGSTPNTKNFSRTPTSWDAEDDILLMHLKDQQKLGWKEIASNFTNRTPNACQFRWRRLKSGNLKNPPKSASALGTQITPKPQPKKPKKTFKLEAGSPPTGFQGAYSPIANATFTGFDNNVSNALAGLNALSNTPSNISSPLPNYHTNPSTPGVNSPNNNNSSSNHLNHNYNNSPKSEVSLDPQSHNNAPGNTGGGYYAELSIDPTMNLPHNQPHPHTPHSITPRNSTSQASSGNQSSTNNPLHSNSIIQIVRDERNSVTSTRASVSSLPSKSMNIPHHQLNNSALAHLPILFGGGSSISGPSRNLSISGPGGIHHSTTVSSLRNGSVVSSNLGYYSRSGSVVIPFNAEKKDEDHYKIDTKAESKTPKNLKKAKIKPTSKSSTPNTPVFKIPWSMEEDELLINRRNRELSFAELSILLPQRTEGEIWSRIDYLEKLRNGHRASASRDHRRRRQSSIGLDDVDDFYEDVDDVIGGIGVSEDEDEDEDDDEVLVDVDESISGSRKRRKRRASSAVNPLTVSESIRKRLR